MIRSRVTVARMGEKHGCYTYSVHIQCSHSGYNDIQNDMENQYDLTLEALSDHKWAKYPWFVVWFAVL